MSALDDDQIFDHYLATCSDRECWDAFRDHFANSGFPLNEQQIRDTPLPIIMKNIRAGFDNGTLDVSRRWIPFLERAFRYVQTRN